MRWCSHLLSAATCVLVVLLGSPARAYVPARDEATGRELRWKHREIVLTLSDTFRSRDMRPDEVSAALTQAAAVWTSEVGCDGIQFRVLPPSAAADQARRDGVNAVLVHEKTWCRSGERGRFSCYDSDEQAVTTTYLERDEHTGEVWIAEADIEVNAVDFRWSQADSAIGVSLAGLFVHELGHVIGLAHGCDDGMLPDSALDHEGRRPAPCLRGAATQVLAMAPDPPSGGGVALAPDERRAGKLWAGRVGCRRVLSRHRGGKRAPSTGKHMAGTGPG